MMRKKFIILFFLLFATWEGASIFSQSFDLKTEKENIGAIENAIETGDNPALVKICDTFLDPHKINAYAYFICGKFLLFVPEQDAQKARANAKKAYNRLKIASDDFAKTSKQVFYTLDAWQYLGLAAMLMGDFDRAETHFKQVLSRDNRTTAAWYNLGIIYEYKGLEVEAMRAFDRYLRLKGSSEDLDY